MRFPGFNVLLLLLALVLGLLEGAFCAPLVGPSRRGMLKSSLLLAVWKRKLQTKLTCYFPWWLTETSDEQASRVDWAPSRRWRRTAAERQRGPRVVPATKGVVDGRVLTLYPSAAGWGTDGEGREGSFAVVSAA